ncbi:hypothetical protein FRAHR75_160058 [Frankia sp. Hr75.2]|nr:hypothetical protein FRAHR75_160058 [Frankia sp. Hr75.2]
MSTAARGQLSARAAVVRLTSPGLAAGCHLFDAAVSLRVEGIGRPVGLGTASRVALDVVDRGSAFPPAARGRHETRDRTAIRAPGTPMVRECRSRTFVGGAPAALVWSISPGFSERHRNSRASLPDRPRTAGQNNGAKLHDRKRGQRGNGYRRRLPD